MAADPRQRAASGDPSPEIPAEKARQGTIILRSVWQRVLFLAGLVGVVAIAILMAVGAFG